jgi:hypothetical protein
MTKTLVFTNALVNANLLEARTVCFPSAHPHFRGMSWFFTISRASLGESGPYTADEQSRFIRSQSPASAAIDAYGAFRYDSAVNFDFGHGAWPGSFA